MLPAVSINVPGICCSLRLCFISLQGYSVILFFRMSKFAIIK